MARRKDDILDRLMAGFSLRGIFLHSATWFLLATGLTIFGAIKLWEQYQHKILATEDYRLTPEKIDITPPPAWAHADLQQVVLSASSEKAAATILDTNLVAKTANAFRTVGWVEQVERVEKNADGLNVQLRYRQPAAVVELNRTNIPGWPAKQAAEVMPVDRLGTVMPGELVQHLRLPRISVFQPVAHNQLVTWTTWPDERIVEAAEILAAIGPQAEQLGIYRITTRRVPGRTDHGRFPFELWPTSGTQVIWGSGIGSETINEASAQQRLQALVEYVRQHGPLNTLPKQRIDVRSGRALISESM